MLLVHCKKMAECMKTGEGRAPQCEKAGCPGRLAHEAARDTFIEIFSGARPMTAPHKSPRVRPDAKDMAELEEQIADAVGHLCTGIHCKAGWDARGACHSISVIITMLQDMRRDIIRSGKIRCEGL